MIWERSSKKAYIKTTVEHSSFAGKFEVGSRVKIVDIEDEEGNQVTEIGWIIWKRKNALKEIWKKNYI